MGWGKKLIRAVAFLRGEVEKTSKRKIHVGGGVYRNVLPEGPRNVWERSKFLTKILECVSVGWKSDDGEKRGEAFRK